MGVHPWSRAVVHHSWTAVAMAPERGTVDGGQLPGRRQGTTGRLAIEGQEKVGVCLRLGPGRIRARIGHPHAGEAIGRSVRCFPRSP